MESAHCVVHRLSGIVHCMETSDSLLCGRRMSLNMKPIDFPWEERATHEFCEQCNKALYRWTSETWSEKNSAGNLPAVNISLINIQLDVVYVNCRNMQHTTWFGPFVCIGSPGRFPKRNSLDNWQSSGACRSMTCDCRLNISFDLTV